MSGAVGLSLAAAALALVGGLFGATPDAARRWRAAAAFAVALIVAGTWWVAAPRGEIGHPLTAEARDAAGAPVSTVVVLQREGARRQVRRLPLRQPLDGAEGAFWAAIALGLLGGALGLRRETPGPKWLPAALPVAGAAAPLAVFLGAGGAASGEAGVRAWLARFDPGPLESFTVPDLPWSFHPEGTAALGVAVAIGALGLASAIVGPRRLDGARLLAPAAALAAGAAIWRMLEVGGLPWRPAEGALWAVAALLSVAAFERGASSTAALRSATLVGAAVALAAVALGA